MPVIQDLLPVVPNQSDLSTGDVPRSSVPDAGIDLPSANPAPARTNQQWWDNFAQAPASIESKMDPVKFDWEKSGADRFVNSDHIRQEGFDPYMGSKTIGDKTYDLNELRYQQVQTWGDVMKNGVGQFGSLAWNSFKQGFSSDGHLLNALFNWGSDLSFKERLIGTPDELLEEDREQKAIMNKYPIFESPATQGVFNKEFLGNMIGQLGFTVGTAGYVALESLLTLGIADVLAPLSKAGQLARLGKAIQTAETVAESAQYVRYADAVRKGTATGEMINDIRKMTDIAKDRNFMQKVYNTMKNAVPGVEAAGNYNAAIRAGGTTAEAISAGLPGLVKSWTMFGAARAEATMEASSTYGQLYTALQDDYTKKHGYAPQGEDLENIRTAAYGAATDNYIVNTGLLTVMNELEFGNMVSKFSSTKRLFTDAAQQAGRDMYSVTAKDATGAVISRAYKTGRLGAIVNLGAMRRDFGLGTALWQIGKKAASGQAAKFEFMEGLQEILQNSSDNTLREYYTNLYNGNKDLNGGFLKDITSADWSKGLATQLNQEGWKTFLMGATTGLFLSPISSAAMYAKDKTTQALNSRYKDQVNANKKLTDENINILNQFYKTSKDQLLQHIANTKTQMVAAKNMQGALPESDRYMFYNSQDDALVSAANTAMRTGTMDNFLETLSSMADGRLTDEEFSQAIGSADTVNAKEKIGGIVQEIKQYYTNYQNLMDRYGDLIIPEIHSDPEQYNMAQEQRTALHEAISILATTDYHATQAIKRAGEIKSEMSNLPGIGMSVAHTFDIIGSRTNVDKEIGLLQEQIKTYEALGSSKDQAGKDIAQILKNNKVQLQVLQEWVENLETGTDETLRKLFGIYIRTQNIISGTGPTVIDDRQLEKAFDGLGDYIALNRDHGHYIEALNVLTNPRNLRTLWYRILKAQKEAVETVAEHAKQEAKDRADATVGKTETTPEEVPTETDEEQPSPEEPQPEDTGKQNTYETDRAAILKHYIENGRINPNSAIDPYEDLENKLSRIDEYYPAEERKQAKEDAINDYFDSKVNKVTNKLVIPNLKGDPHIVESAGKYYVEHDGKKISESTGSIRTANRDLQKYIDQNYPHVKGTEYRVGQTVYDEYGEYTIVEKDGKYMLRPGKEKTRNKDIPVTVEELIENYSYIPQEKSVETTPEDTTTPYDPSQPKSSDPYALTNIGANDRDTQKLTANILAIPEEANTTGSGYSITVRKNPTVAQDIYPIQGNTQIIQKGQQYSIQLQHNGTVIGYITNPAPQVYRTPIDQNKISAIVNRNTFNRNSINLGNFDPKNFIGADDSIIKNNLKIGDRITFYVEKERKGIWDGNSIKEKNTENPWGTLGIVSSTQGWLRNDSAIEREGRVIEKTVQQLTLADIEALYQMTPQMPTAEVWRNHLRDQDNQGAALQNIIEQALKKGGTISLEGIVQMEPHYSYNWIGTDEHGPKLSDIQGIQRDSKGVKMYVVSNYDSELEYVQSTMSEAEEDIAKKVKPAGQMSMYTAIVILDNGRYIPIQLTPRQITVVEQQQLISDISGIENNEQLTKANEQLKKLFITLPVYDREDTKGMMISVRSVGLGSDNHLVVAVNQRMSDGKIVKLGETKNIQASIGSAEEMVKYLNIALQANEQADIPKITVDNLKWQPSRENIADMEASVHADIFKSISMTYKVINTDGGQRVNDNKPAIQQSAPVKQDTQEDIARELKEQLGVTDAIVKHIHLAGINYVQTADNRYYVIPDSHGEQLWENAKEVTQEQISKPFRTKSEWDKVGQSVQEAVGIDQPAEPVQEVKKAKRVSKLQQKKAITEELSNVKDSPAQKLYDDAIATVDRIGKREDGGVNIYSIKPLQQVELLETLRKAGLGGGNENQALSILINATVDKSDNDLGIKARLKSILESRQLKEQRNVVPKITQYNTFSVSDIESIDRFTEFMKDNLPDWITLGELDDVAATLQATHTTVGQMVMYINDLGNVAGRIETRAENPYKYHEAFHAVYRLLLNPTEQQRLLDTIAEPTQTQLDELLQSHDRYIGMSREQLVREWKEEEMGDQFDKYSMDRSKSTSGNLVRTWFNKLLDWIKWVKDVLTGNRLRALVYKVHTGDYKTAGLQQNSFTENITVNSPVPKAIVIGKDTTEVKLDNGQTKTVYTDRMLNSSIASRITTDITAQVILEKGQSTKTYDQVIESVLDKYQKAYDPNSQRNQDILDSIENDRAAEIWDDMLTDIYLAMEKGSEGRDILKQNIQETLRIQGIRQSIIDEEQDDVDEYTGNPFKDKSSIGGYSTVEKDLRTYMSSTNVEFTPIVPGIETFDDNTPMIQAVDTNVVYNGMLKLLSQSVDQGVNISNILQYRANGNDPEVIAFINKWLSESGFNIEKYEATGIAECANQEGLNLFYKVLKQLSEVYNNYMSILEDTGTKKVSIVDSGKNSSERVQYNEWANAFYQVYYKEVEQDTRTRQKSTLSDDRYREAIKPIQEIYKHTGTQAARGRAIDDNTLAILSKDISDNLMIRLGINIHPNYIMYTIVSYKDSDVRTERQNKMLLLYPTAKAIDVQLLDTVLKPVLKAHRNPFIKPQGEVKKTATESLLMNIAKNNTLFDSTVNSLSHTNNKGDSVYNYQYPSYNTATVQRLNDRSYVAELQSNPDTNSSYLMSDDKFLSMTKSMFNAGGISLKGTVKDDEGNIKVRADQRTKQGVDFSGFNDREYDAYNLALYDISTNPDAVHGDRENKWYTVPISLGTIAEKSTHHAVYVPVIHAVEEKGGKIGVTAKVKEILYNEVETECRRIQRVYTEIAEGRDAVIASGREWIDGYHDGAQRGLRLFTTRELLGTELAEVIESAPENVEEYLADIVKAIDKNLMKQVEQKRLQMIEEGLIDSNNKNILAPEYLFKGIGTEFDGPLNLQSGKFIYNLAQKYVNDYTGYVGISRVLYGDKAKSCKSVEDWWKRMAGFNGQGMDISTVAGTPEIAPVETLKCILYPEDKFTTKQGDTAVANDGQAEVTAKGYKQFLIARGKLSDLENTMLEKAQAGKELTTEEFIQMLENGAGLNSIKPLYRDGETYLKCSIGLLSRADVSMKMNGMWVAIPGREILHDKLNAAEQEENGEDNDNIVILGNKSISKSKTANLLKPGEQPTPMMYTDIAANNMRVQTETPATKDTGNKSTQPDKQILASQDPNKMVYYQGKLQKAGKVMQEYMDSGHQRVVNNAIEVISNLFSPVESLSDKELKDVKFDEGKFQDKAIDTIKATGKDTQTIEMWTTLGGVAQYDINLPNMVETASSVFLSNMIKGVTKEKVPMWKMILRSDTGMSVMRKVTMLTEGGQPKMWDIITMDEYKKNPVEYKSLTDDRFTDLQVGDVVCDRLRDNIPRYSADGKKILYYYTEGLRPYMSVDEKVNGKISEALSQCFGARTPGTGFQSYRRVLWVDRLSDQLANTAIISRDAMVSTGHDYDVDSLFCAIPATYTVKGKRVQYGTAETEEDKFNEYIRWQISHNDAVRDLLESDVVHTDEEWIATMLGTYTKEHRIADILKSLQLPSTVAEWKKRGGDKLNNGVLVNRGLEAQMALLSGEHVSGGGKDALIARPTSTAGIEAMVQNLAAELTTGEHSTEAQKIADRLTGNLGDMNGLTGQLNAYKAMQQGGEGIGGVANILQTTAVLNQFDKKLRTNIYKFDNKTYDEYRGNKNSVQRKRDEDADILAQIHVDATKNQLPSKLAITAEYAGLLTHMVKLGQTLENAILYPQTKPWIEYARRTAYGRRTFKESGKGESDIQVLVSMTKALKDKGAVIVPLNRQTIIDYIKGGSKDINVELSLVNDLKTMILNTEPLKMMSRFMRFDTGRLLGTWEEIDHMKQGLNELGIDMTDEEFAKEAIPIDVRDIIKKRHGNMSANYKVLKALDILGKKVFIERTETFREIQDSVMGNMEIPEWDRLFTKTLKHDIISYLSLTAYMKSLKDNNRQEVLDSMNNRLIWDNPESPYSIISIIQNLRGQLKGRNTNYALNSFLNTVIQGTTPGADINQVIANTWTRMSDQQQEKVVGAIVDIVANKKGDIHKGGIALFNYLLVKDGGQFKSGSYIRFIPPFMMKEWSDSMSKVVNVLSGKIGKNTYQNTFGYDKQTLIDKFTQAYWSHVDSQGYIIDSTGISPDGSSKQWKGAKAVFGEYPSVQRTYTPSGPHTTGPIAGQQYTQITDGSAIQELANNYGILAMTNGTDRKFIDKQGNRVGQGISPNQLLAQMRGEVMQSAQPVVSSQRIPTDEEVQQKLKECNIK